MYSIFKVVPGAFSRNGNFGNKEYRKSHLPHFLGLLILYVFISH